MEIGELFYNSFDRVFLLSKPKDEDLILSSHRFWRIYIE